MNKWTIKKLLDWTRDFFAKKGIESSRLDAELLLAHALQISRVELYLRLDQPLNESELEAYRALVQRRSQREPLAYLVGEKEFFSHRFLVGPEVLIPRPETEELVEHAIAFLNTQNLSQPKILDIGTGSGCILLSIMKTFPNAMGWGWELSQAAIRLAQKNAEKLDVKDQLQWINGDIYQAWPKQISGPFDLITANLPYISNADYQDLQPEVKNHEPKTALLAGPEGFDALARVLPQIQDHVHNSGMALFEIGGDQAISLKEKLPHWCPGLNGDFIKDISGKDRILQLKPL